MGTLFAALALFAAVAAAVTAARLAPAEGSPALDHDGAPRRLPQPGARDLHALTGGVLAPARVPTWG